MAKPALKLIQGGKTPKKAALRPATGIIVVLELKSLGKASPRLTAEQGLVFAQAASVTLDSLKHSPPVRLIVRASQRRREFDIKPLAVTEAMRATHHDEIKATEEAAYGIAILLAKEIGGLTVTRRSIRGEGVDWWLSSDPNLPFTHRMEVSGTCQRRPGELARRVAMKTHQAKQSAGTRTTAIVVVVDFVALTASYRVRS